MTDVRPRSGALRRPLRAAALVSTLLAVAGVALATPAAADDTTAAWSVQPADPTGAADGRTRFDLQADPGATVQEHALLANSSTVERTFVVYGADGFTTASGGFDLGPASEAPVDLGSWVSVSPATVTVPPLTTVPLDLTVTVPADATPGDHVGGLVVSPEKPQETSEGVLLDTRVAVRLSVRVSGEISASLQVRDVTATFDGSAVPFATGTAAVTYTVVNTGNVTVVARPRVRISAPFGVRLGRTAHGEELSVVPGGTFTLTTAVPDVAPALLDRAVVDVTTAAVPGIETDLPLVSVTAGASFLAVSWTGLAAAAVLLALVVAVVRAGRRRREEQDGHWEDAVAAARRELAAGPAPAQIGPGRGGDRNRTGAFAALPVALVLAGLAASGAAGSTTSPAAELPAADDTGGSLSLSVPAAPRTPTPTPTTGTSPGSGPATGTGGTTPTRTGVRAATGVPVADDTEPAPAAVDPSPGASPTAAAAQQPDLLWRGGAGSWPGGLTGTLVGGGAAAAGAGLTGWFVRRRLLPGRPPVG